ncbi:MAG: hypothetical protein K0U47_11680 [Epsilonproteobacteria bacterium]|nr:hypothetical protein [Campylobacterota bacterium]
MSYKDFQRANDDWVGVYPYGTSNDGGNVLSWAWVNGENTKGIVEIGGVAQPGYYSVRVFNNNEVGDEAQHKGEYHFRIYDCNPANTISSVYELKNKAAGANPGEVVCIQNGTYKIDNITFSATGTENNPIHFVAPGGNVIIQGVNATSTENNFWVTGKYLVFKDFAVKNFGNGVHIARRGGYGEAPNNILVENVKSSNNFYSGIVVDGGFEDDSTGFGLVDDSQKPSYITIKDCDVSWSSGRGNYETHGDGINIRAGVGKGNRIIGCRVFDNVDDGVDLWQAGNKVEIYNTWSYNNGKQAYDINGEPIAINGTGFKLGRSLSNRDADGQFFGPYYDGHHVITHCLAWENKGVGFTDASSLFYRILKYNTAFDNRRAGFEFNSDDALYNNIAFANNPNTLISGVYVADEGNSWNANINISESNLIRTQSAYDAAKGDRKENGMLPDTDYLKFINANHPYINTGYWANY